MGPELHSQMIAYRIAELRQEAADYRLVHEAAKKHPEAKPRRSLFGKIIPA
ncbi:hypothetical protein [Streptosporangium sp. 'caverna']|uniref:hypothetical protein n=1 Tax=Streptosporangium sp. 'caverna' TaxID=2202249 RepID=UPI0013A6F365|nr:hypothetical protein [Streptosporangium sp. 'caverna']